MKPMTINAAISAPITAGERAKVLVQFPELGDPNFKDPDDATKTANDHIESWVRYWRAMKSIVG